LPRIAQRIGVGRLIVSDVLRNRPERERDGWTEGSKRQGFDVQFAVAPARLFDRRVHSPENLSSVIQKEFCNTIWHQTDVDPTTIDVCDRGQSGHSVAAPPYRLMTDTVEKVGN
jgi:hypothetical protein